MKANVSKVAKLIEELIENSGKKQKEISEELGYEKPNIITMFKQGQTRLPIPKVPLMAKALDVDPVYLLRVVMEEYEPETWAVIESLIGGAPSTSEREVLATFRSICGKRDVKPTPEEKKELAEMFKGWKKKRA